MKPTIKAHEYFRDDKKRIDDGALLLAAQAREVGVGVALLHAVEKRLEELDAIIHTNPVRDEKNLRKDLVYMLGEIHMAEWILAFPGEARRILDKADGADTQ